MSNKEPDQAVIDAMNMMLDKNLADVEDLPEYLDKVANGFYRLKIYDIEKKPVEINNADKTGKIQAPVIQFQFEVVSCAELEDSSKDPATDGAKPGGRFNESFFLHDKPDMAIASIKAKYKDIAESLKIENVLVLVDTLKGMEIMAKVKTIADKKKDDTFYIRVSNAQAL